MRVPCTVDEIDMEGEYGGDVPGVCVTCSRCDNQTESFGTGPASVRRCLVLLREECPNEESNFYVAEEGEE